MTTEEIQKLKEILQARKDQIKTELESVAVKSPSIKGDYDPKMPNYDDDMHDEDSYVREVSDMAVNVAYEQQLEKELEDIQTTLKKIDDGTYGKCEKCAQAIHSERLKAMPVAKLCISCAKIK
ncbi:MAG: hypothetical protein A3G02_03005 [Candidatus Yanofskybacteria bacterium RIFCSPLOWO2_12_FULL_44_13b]|uniref:Zinc finger DksA/TraR C4-type domain-containing protein n=2 Tax=Candidatus Yanofskyibacteriota TaxID=1752733 RepID=A0A1F8GZR0_9BACT|nr:MAG: DnaK suppressor protein DksA [Candidatus Yanofskybacteria bacterium GW2011_GWA2_44_10]KKT90041.1 MAG: DnaK suppressor protein DksA [Candidatus Yanofskybacteria bacterium GW2011_GWB1_45_11]OGN03797.1 MAG: hypothetical protein A2657_00145 [Candidatus Yanofskybacteria bacterium RIFCSPHIGHO2_01_FULL_44_110b]OGN14708.1 MAG: hypothetical protein A3C01_02085 [Candidatus Yanofskybacteria bacterium RIFCSPHIGHO2_02_FULL_44_36b]OGN18334.1 MAG: hypothetical protein A3F50_00315 [Candidatus Yanofskyb